MKRKYPPKYCSYKCKSVAMTGCKVSEEQKLKQSITMKGIPKSAEAKKKMSEAWKNRIAHPQTLESRLKLSLQRRGSLNPAWKGGVKELNQMARHCLEYSLWRESVLKRDDYTCQECGTQSTVGNFILMHADHIKPFIDYPELRYAIDNGRTLCVPCHRKTPTWGNAKEYAKQNS